MSYKKQEFIDYMFNKGNANPGGYCNALDNIEKILGVNIDDEFETGQCSGLYNRLQALRKEPEQIGKNEHDIRTYASRLKKYIEFRQEAASGSAEHFTWIPFFKEFADILLGYRNNRRLLLAKIKDCFAPLPFEYPFKEQGAEDYDDIDPFTVFGSFNKGLRFESRISILKAYKVAFGIHSDIPTDFDGVPVLMNMSAWFFAYKKNRREQDIDNLWELFETALAYADGDASKEQHFIDIFDEVVTQKQIKWNITIGLYWVRPEFFLSLDSVNRTYLHKFNPPVMGAAKLQFKDPPNGREYLDAIKFINSCFPNAHGNTFGSDYSYVNSFYWLSYFAYCYSNETPIESDTQENNSIKEAYTKTEFLREVYMSPEKYEDCKERLLYKKNLILQGAPGVGKTFAAKRLAWSIMECKDDSRIEFVQFHQNYSYEDFIMGYKPSGDTFVLENGIFYDFCLKAKNDPKNKYFFIIDEINRGNMSKIFGELLMLIENEYRGTEIKLAYSKEMFTIPDNLYLIGMMNTADRSLAMIDYALRRRFSFVEMEPGFDSDGFNMYQSTIENPYFSKIVSRIKALNADIENDDSLGKGFCIGHSYFCNLSTACKTETLKQIVRYEIIPMIEEYWFDDKTTVQNWRSNLQGVFNE